MTFPLCFLVEMTFIGELEPFVGICWLPFSAYNNPTAVQREVGEVVGKQSHRNVSFIPHVMNPFSAS